MKKKQKIILIGPCGGGVVPKNGASAKNSHLAKFLKEHGANLCVIDTERWRRNPFILLDLFFKVLFNTKAKFIVATDNMSGYRTMQALSLFPWKRHVIYWIIGGSIANWIERGKVKAEPYKIVDVFLVEGKKMQKTFSCCGFNNTIYVPNFKHITFIPHKEDRTDGTVRFVFLSRIIPQKGCNLILDAAKMLADYQDRFSVDFYGPVDDSFEQKFRSRITESSNVNYKGFLDLREPDNYKVLAKYDVMLFPTYWEGEGFPGIAIDAFIAGLPVIATDWSLNSDIIEDGKTGKILSIRPKVSDYENKAMSFDEKLVTSELAEAMRQFIDHPESIEQMAKECQKTAIQYDVNNVLSTELLNKIGLDI